MWRYNDSETVFVEHRSYDSDPPIPLDIDPVIEAYKRDIDRTLLRQQLQRTATERLQALMTLQCFAEELRRAGRAVRRAAG